MAFSAFGSSRPIIWKRIAWFVALMTVVTLALTAMERTEPGASAAAEPAVDSPIGIAHTSANNTSSVSNSSNGTATIRTGDATATGTQSNTNIVQRADVDAFRGFVFVNQNARVSISGTAVANTGGNTAIGNNSTNTATSNSSSSAS